jgi:hypothetical protein
MREMKICMKMMTLQSKTRGEIYTTGKSQWKSYPNITPLPLAKNPTVRRVGVLKDGALSPQSFQNLLPIHQGRNN